MKTIGLWRVDEEMGGAQGSLHLFVSLAEVHSIEVKSSYLIHIIFFNMFDSKATLLLRMMIGMVQQSTL
jgi:hypothetical protein